MNRKHSLIQFFMALILAAGLLAPAALAVEKTDAASRIQPLLAQLAAEQPDEIVRVIVQKDGQTHQAEALVARLGGLVLIDLPLINGFAAELPAAKVPRLGAEASVIWVSLDAPMVPTVESGNTVRDEFNSTSYSNNDGSVSWSTDWIEIGDGGSPSSGDIDVQIDDCPDSSSRCVEFDGDAALNSSIEREVDLSSATSAILTFDYHLDDTGAEYLLEVSPDGGTTWTVLQTYTEPSNNSGTIDLSLYLSDFTRIRFRLTDRDEDVHFYIDNVEIAMDASVDVPGGSPPEADPNAPAVFTTWAAEPGITTLDANRLARDFKNYPIPAGRTIWFNSFIKVDHITAPASTVFFEDVTVTFTANGKIFSLPVPDGEVTISEAVTLATTSFDEATGRWVSSAPEAYENKEVFLTGLAYQVPESLPAGIQDVTWTGHFTTDTATVTGEWRWSAAVYSGFSSDYNALGIKPLKEDKNNPYLNNDPVGTPENFKGYLVPGATGDGGTKYVGDFTSGAEPIFRFHQAEVMADHVGPDGEYGFGSKVVGGFGGLAGEFTPGYDISQVEFVLQAYAPATFNHDVKLTITSEGQSKTKTLKHETFEAHRGEANAGLIYVDVTDAWDWEWSRFDTDLEIFIDQLGLDPDEYVYYDAVGLRVTALPGTPDEDVRFPKMPSFQPIDTSQLLNVYNGAVRAPEVWNEAPAYLQGQGVTVAIVDSGIGKIKDLGKRAFRHVNFNREYHDSQDRYGHGTFVASIVAADGEHSKGEYMGIAPKAFMLNIRVSNDEGMGYESDIVDALQWLRTNKEAYNVRVVNLSLNSSVAQDYHDSPLCAAVEILWFDGIVVVVSGGNNGTAEIYPPANDPFVITVGATEDKGTVSISDDTVASFSAYGLTAAGTPKPDLVAPGKDIITYLPNNNKLNMGQAHPEKIVSNDYFRMSGTSMAAPMVTGAVALLLQDEPDLTPDQVKFRLMATARTDWAGYDPVHAGAGYLDIYAAVHGTTLEAANQSVMPHMLLARMALMAYWASQNGGENIDWGALNWNDVNWNSVNWNDVNWNAVNWNDVNWNAVNWNDVNWNAVNWNAVNWNAVNWNAVNWNAVNWNAVNWNSDYWGE